MERLEVGGELADAAGVEEAADSVRRLKVPHRARVLLRRGGEVATREERVAVAAARLGRGRGRRAVARGEVERGPEGAAGEERLEARGERALAQARGGAAGRAARGGEARAGREPRERPAQRRRARDDLGLQVKDAQREQRAAIAASSSTTEPRPGRDRVLGHHRGEVPAEGGDGELGPAHRVRRLAPLLRRVRVDGVGAGEEELAAGRERRAARRRAGGAVLEEARARARVERGERGGGDGEEVEAVAGAGEVEARDGRGGGRGEAVRREGRREAAAAARGELAAQDGDGAAGEAEREVDRRPGARVERGRLERALGRAAGRERARRARGRRRDAARARAGGAGGADVPRADPEPADAALSVLAKREQPPGRGRERVHAASVRAEGGGDREVGAEADDEAVREAEPDAAARVRGGDGRARRQRRVGEGALLEEAEPLPAEGGHLTEAVRRQRRAARGCDLWQGTRLSALTALAPAAQPCRAWTTLVHKTMARARVGSARDLPSHAEEATSHRRAPASAPDQRARAHSWSPSDRLDRASASTRPPMMAHSAPRPQPQTLGATPLRAPAAPRGALARPARRRRVPRRATAPPVAAAAPPPPPAADGGAADGDGALQDSLVSMLRLEIGKKDVESYVEESGEHLRAVAEEAKAAMEAAAELSRLRSEVAFDSALADINAEADAFEAQLRAARAASDVAEAEQAEWEAGLAASRSEGQFFKSLYPAEPRGAGGASGGAASPSGRGGAYGNLDADALAARRAAAARVGEPAAAAARSPLRAALFGALGALLLADAGADLASAAPDRGADALYAGLAALAAWLAVNERRGPPEPPL